MDEKKRESDVVSGVKASALFTLWCCQVAGGESSSAEELSNKTQTRGDFIWLKMSTECVFIIDQLSVA